MCSLLVLADDLTGALDTGVQFAKRGIPTRVYPAPGGREDAPAGGVLVINTDSRHRPPSGARRLIAGILERYPAVPHVYKKTDSTLRGNIGAELEALIRARNAAVLPFVPAYPGLGRSTRGGRQYLDGIPIDKTAAAFDALNPVRRSFIPDIIAEQSELPVRLIPAGVPAGDKGGEKPEICVYDAESAADLRNIARGLGEGKLLGTTAGCAGFAEFLADHIPFGGPVPAPPDGPEPGPLLIVSGSRHPVSLGQVKAALEAGVPALAVEGEKLLRPGWLEGEEAASIVSRGGALLRAGGRCILGTRASLGGPAKRDSRAAGDAGIHERGRPPGLDGGESPQGAAGPLGKLSALVLTSAGPAHLAVFGGDTLLGIMEALGRRPLRPIREIRPGLVLAAAELPGGPLFIAAKSGAFGEPGIIAELDGFFRRGTAAPS